MNFWREQTGEAPAAEEPVTAPSTTMNVITQDGEVVYEAIDDFDDAHGEFVGVVEDHMEGHRAHGGD